MGASMMMQGNYDVEVDQPDSGFASF